MALIELRVSEIENMENQLKKMNNKLEDCCNSVQNKKNNLNMRVANQSDITSRLENVIKLMNQQVDTLQTCSSYVNESIGTFSDVDSSISNSSISNIIKDIANISLIGSTMCTGIGAIESIAHLVNEDGKSRLLSGISEKIKEKVGETVEFYKDAYSVIKEEWNTVGSPLYKVKEYGKAALKLVGSVGMIASGVMAIGGSCGLGTAVGGITIAYGVEKGISAFSDFKNIYEGNYEDIGKNNVIENAAEECGEKFGELIGNEELGEAVFEGIYKSGEIISEVTTISNTLDSIHQLPDINISGMVDEIPQAFKGVGELLTTDITALKYQTTLLSYTIPNITEGVRAIAALDDLKGDVTELTKTVVNLGSDIYLSFVK